MSHLEHRSTEGKCENICGNSFSLQNGLQFYDNCRRGCSMPRMKYVPSDDHTEDGNESDISSSFSLQECMNEFRARRIQRTRLNQLRQNETRKSYGKNDEETTEIDPINQNLSNKEQERKCKPCRNGFCYCFTSDSGDGVNHDGLRKKNSLHRRSECSQLSNSSNAKSKYPQNQTTVLKCTKKNKLTAISSIEESTGKSPLIHIIHEIHENSVISKVKFNKAKLQTFGKLIRPNTTTDKAQPRGTDQVESKLYGPTAPNWDILDDSDVPGKIKPKSYSNFSERHSYLGGQLLHKRFITRFRYKQKDLEESELEPSKSSISSSDTSVREAERFLDNFLETKRNGKITLNHSMKEEKKSDVNIPRKIKADEKYFCAVARKKCPTYPSLSDVPEAIEYGRRSPHKKSNNSLKDDAIIEVNSGYSEAKIRDTLSFDPKLGELHSSSCLAEPIPKNEKLIGWQLPHKVDLDVVDGAVHHNLASNMIDKNTPVKGKITSQNQKLKGRSVGKNLFWSQKLKHLSPWSNNNNNNSKNYNKDGKKNCSKSKAFITSSKTKFLHLISPRKNQRNQNPKNSNDFQTPPNEDPQIKNKNKREYNYFSQSPSGSYKSPRESSHTQIHNRSSSSSNSLNKTEEADFDFSRTVHSPSKRAVRCGQRKLDFPLNCASAQKDCEEKTYRSFSSELEHDISISKINYILNNIRSKLEANDQQVLCTFQEAESIAGPDPVGFECPDNRIQQNIGENKTSHPSRAPKSSDFNANEPIYSEIVDESIYLSEGPDFANHTSIQHYGLPENPEILYTKINKLKLHNDKDESKLKSPVQPIPLSNILVNSFRIEKFKNDIIQAKPVSSVPKRSSYLPFPSNSALPRCQSFDNIRLREQNSYPNKDRHLTKSDLSLQRSELFLEKLCLNELIVNPDCGGNIVGKIQSDTRNSSGQHDATVRSSSTDVFYETPQCDQIASHTGYTIFKELPNEDSGNSNSYIPNSAIDGSNLHSSAITSPSSSKQSTLKKHSFVTKNAPIMNESKAGSETKCHSYNVYQSTPTSQDNARMSFRRKQNRSRSLSLSEVSYCESLKKSPIKNTLPMEKYKSFKNVLRKSFRKSKMFVRERGKQFSKSMNLATRNTNMTTGKQLEADLDFNIEDLFSVNDSSNISQQIAETVRVCRQMPDLETSMEMVEAERLLLYSSLRRKKNGNYSSTARKKHFMNQKSSMRFFVNEMHLPVSINVDQDMVFNIFFIVTFESDGLIISSQSAECQNGVAVFRDNDNEFIYSTECEAYRLGELQQNAVKCNIFMLRLRKLSTASIEYRKETIECEAQTPLATSSSISSISSASSCGIVSRFRLQASFTLNANDFVPYEYVHDKSKDCDRIFVRSSCSRSLPLIHRTKSTNLLGEIHLKGGAEICSPKFNFDGFLDVQDPYKQHYWNRRYCTLDGIFLYVWQDKTNFNAAPLMSIDLRNPKHYEHYPLTCSPRELCARPRSFHFVLESGEPSKAVASSAVFFSADTQTNLDNWLKNLNTVMDFVVTWLK